MADTMRFDLVSPEGVLASQDADSVDIPVTEGDMTAMPGHAALIATLKPGILRVRGSGSADEFVVTGGFVEVEAKSATVLAERACRRGDVTGEIFDGLTAKAEDEVRAAEGARRDVAETRLASLKSLRSELSL